MLELWSPLLTFAPQHSSLPCYHRLAAALTEWPLVSWLVSALDCETREAEGTGQGGQGGQGGPGRAWQRRDLERAGQAPSGETLETTVGWSQGAVIKQGGMKNGLILVKTRLLYLSYLSPFIICLLN